ncbi:MAG: aminodeoxychorismate synthase component I [Gammaproteobacteria bacterium]|nr:aminodeoxychorismate synthase component I [Gammaproteobacteria bacterium]
MTVDYADAVVQQLDHRPDMVALHRRYPRQYPFILESAADGTPQGRFDILFAFPEDEISLQADRRGFAGKRDFLNELDRQLENFGRARSRTDSSQFLPFRGGWFVYLGYELAQQIEPTLDLPLPTTVPTAFAVRIPVALVYCHTTGSSWVVTEQGYEAAHKKILHDLAGLRSHKVTRRALLENPLTEDPPEDFVDAVKKVKRHIIDGDVFQVNLSRAWRGEVIDSWHDAEMYRRLRRANPGPFAGLAVWNDLAIISSSPERLIRLGEGRIETRPIAGTRPRGDAEALDAALSRELIGHPKERAEHVMLIDLERNDLGRVCRPGSVKVDELMVIESYAHVHHIVSNVCGELRADVTPGEAIRATFPGGTITGCPKVRCMEIIAALERTPRGPYTGSMGYLNHDGSGDLNILIRTIVRAKSALSLRAGAGIVADSDPYKELAETGFKAKGLIKAIASDTCHAK